MTRKLTAWVCVSVAMMVLAQTAWGGKTIYVDAGATGSNNGTSWGNAYVYLQDAIGAAVANDEIRVAAGVYRPDQGASVTVGNREASFVLKNLVKIYGGYPAGGGATRDIEANPTYLSGDLNGDDAADTLVQNLLTDPTRADNSYHIVYSNLCGSPTLLDGLTITGGQANGAGDLANGGGWYSITNSSPTIINCTFTRNAATTRGGAWYNEGANCKPTLTDVIFTLNFTANRGGAVAMLNTGADTKLVDCQFRKNRATTHGGGTYIDMSSPTLMNCNFSDDYAASGGSLAGVNASAPEITDATFYSSSATNGGAVWLDNCQAEFYDCTFTANSATSGGAIYFNGANNWLNNCEFEENSATNGGAIFSNFSNPQITQNTFFYNTATSGGGALYCFASKVEVNSCKFIANNSVDSGGAIRNYAYNQGYGHAYLTGNNCMFTGNYSTGGNSVGGAVAGYYYRWGDGYGGYNYRYSVVAFINSTFTNNTVVDVGGGIYANHSSSTNTLNNCILYGNADTAGGNYSESAQIYGGNNTVQYSCIQGLSAYIGNGNIGDDPLFADPLGEDWIGGTPDDNLRLTSGSPCVDAGSNALAAGLTTDLDGLPRFVDNPDTTDTGEGAPPIVDMGAYEYEPECKPGFVDAALKEAVEAALGITDPNCHEILGLITLTATSKNIANLTGLESAKNLTTLNLSTNQIIDISPLKNLPLQYLYLGSNLVGSGDWQSTIATLTDLRTLTLHYNGITSIPSFGEQTNLQYLYLYNNNITDLCPLKDHLTKLRSLRVQNNPATTAYWCGTCVPAIRSNNPLMTDFQYDSCCSSKLAADINFDCAVNLLDLAELSSEWLRCTSIYPELCP